MQDGILKADAANVSDEPIDVSVFNRVNLPLCDSHRANFFDVVAA